MNTGAGTVLSGDLGCLMNIAGRLVASRRRPWKPVISRKCWPAWRTGPAIGGAPEKAMTADMEHPASLEFSKNAARARADADLQSALEKLQRDTRLARPVVTGRLPEFEALRDRAVAIKNHTLAHLDHYLETFEANVTDAGGHVHWCNDAGDARETILGICRAAGAKTVGKGKSMVSEEIALNEYLIANGLDVVETDLGEYILQLREETPSHVVMPAIHLKKEQIAATFRDHHTELDPSPGRSTSPGDMTEEARARLREKFLAADVGITGANMLIAETGSIVVVTNEGNGDLTQTLPRVHIVIAAIEKAVPRVDDALSILRILARSATGQEITCYTTFATGPKAARRPGRTGRISPDPAR